ncbi:MAG: phosphoribosyltransferase family protein [Bacteroidota bacterium]|jgi:ComF family protein|nr:MAG: competence protein [Bacteroidota bacterium]
MKRFLAELADDFVSLIYPHYCDGCQSALVKGEDILCTQCLSDLPRTDMHLDANNTLMTRMGGRIPIVAAAAFLRFRKKGKVQRLLHALKYRNRPEIGFRLGYVYGCDLASSGFSNNFDVIVPVPLHAARLRTRGYNQAEEWGRGLAESTGIPLDSGIIRRLRNTKTQTNRNRIDRWENVSEVFAVVDAQRVQGKSVLLVDDVVTTGATLEACGQVLLNAGCSRLGIACIAVAQ